MTVGIVLALGSAVVWGSGDFCGGRASARLDAVRVLGLSALSGIAMLAVLAVATREPVIVDRSMMWAVAAGVSTSLGIAALYHGLAVGSAAVVAPVAAVMAAAIPVLLAMVVEGMPRPVQSAGFVLALAGIFLVARSAPASPSTESGLRFGALAGVGFGGFLVMIGRAHTDAVFIPLAVARGVMLAAAVIVMAARRARFPEPTASPLGLLAGVLDAGGTTLYVLAQQHVRLDVAAVLSSFYPAATVGLARLITHEPVSPVQWAGAAVCVAALALIAA